MVKTASAISAAYLAGLSGLAAAEILWDGRFNDLESSSDLQDWSWANQVGPYQYYIHGSGDVIEYVNLSPDYANPADTGSEQGARISLTDTAYWNGQTMRRTELIPQTDAAINEGRVFYHFSIKRSADNAPATTREHQIAFFESHFTELKSGWLSGASGTSDTHLRWMVGGQTEWQVEWEAGVWHNVAYEIDFGAGTVGFWHSTGAADLEQVVQPVAAGVSSNGKDWHVGVLELPRSGYEDEKEDFYFSGVYVEDGEVTVGVSGPGGGSGGGDGGDGGDTGGDTGGEDTNTTLVTSTKAATTTTTTTAPGQVTTEPPTGAGAEHWAQCGGSGWTGPTACKGSYTCSTVNAWYYQCL